MGEQTPPVAPAPLHRYGPAGSRVGQPVRLADAPPGLYWAWDDHEYNGTMTWQPIRLYLEEVAVPRGTNRRFTKHCESMGSEYSWNPEDSPDMPVIPMTPPPPPDRGE